MAASVTASVAATINSSRTPDSGINTDQADALINKITANFRQSGTTVEKCDLRYKKRHTFVASTAQTIDLTAAVGDDGVTSAFVEIVALVIILRSTTAAARLTIDNAGATNPYTGILNAAGTITIYPSTADGTGALKNHGAFVWVTPVDGVTAVSGTVKNLRLLPSAHAFDADVVVLGRSA